MISQLVALIAGAVLAGGVQAILAFSERRRERESVLTAVAAEVKSICDLIEHDGYNETIYSAAAAVRNNNWDGKNIGIGIKQNYFSVFEALGSKISLIEADKLGKIVSFYAYCRALIDATREDNFVSSHMEIIDPSGDILALEGIIGSIGILGKEIVLMPKKPMNGLILE